MRLVPLALLPLALLACTTDPEIGFTLVSALPADTAGLTLGDDGLASAAMDGQICLLDVQSAEVIGDQDLGTGEERLLDSYGPQVLAAHGDALFLLSRDLEQPTSLVMEPARKAALTDAGDVVVLSSREGLCGVSWASAPKDVWQIPETDCSGAADLAVDRHRGVAWVADGQRLAMVQADGRYATWEVQADRLAYDPSTGHVLVGEDGGDWLGAIDVNGEVAWARPLDGSLVDFDPAGVSGLTAVMIDENGGGMLSLVLGDSGMPIGEFELPDTADVTLSDDGTTMAFVRDEEVLFYRVDADDGLLETPDTTNATPGKATDALVGVTAAGGVTTAALGTALLVAALVD